jgi:hypothetical protein
MADVTFYYLDDDDKRQGPFSAIQLRSWARHLGMNRLVARAPQGMPLPLGHWVTEWDLACASSPESAIRRVPAARQSACASSPVRLLARAAAAWYYTDDDEQVQGPFDAAQLAAWAELLGGTRRAGQSASGPFAPLNEWPELVALADADELAQRAASADPAVPAAERPPALPAVNASAAFAPSPPLPLAASPAAEPTGRLEGAAPGGQTGQTEAASGAAAGEGEQPLIEYLDDAGAVQGPFPAAQIGAWLRAQLLQPARLARPAASAEAFRPMGAISALAPYCAGLAQPPDAPGTLASAFYLYVDAFGTEQGPFALDVMRAWACAGALLPGTLVRTPSQPAHAPLSAWPALSAASHVACAPPSAAQLRRKAALEPPPDRGAAWQAGAAPPLPGLGAAAAGSADYVVRGSFNVRTGRFVAAADVHTHRKGPGLPTDRADRQLAHYFDVELERKKRHTQRGTK